MNSSYRENSLSARDSPCPRRGEGLSLAPFSSLVSHGCSTQLAAAQGSHRCARRASRRQRTQPRSIAAPRTLRRFGTRWDGSPRRRQQQAGSSYQGRSSSHSGPELNRSCRARRAQKHCAVPHVFIGSFYRPRLLRLQPCSVRSTSEVDPRCSPSPPCSSPFCSPHNQNCHLTATLPPPRSRPQLAGQPPARDAAHLPPQRGGGTGKGEREGGGGSCCCPGFPRIKYEQPCCVILNC